MVSLWEMFEKHDAKCIIWTGPRSGEYGSVYFQGKQTTIHRLVMMLLRPKEFKKYPNVLHKCDNKLCYNPDHLYCGDDKDNADDRKYKNVRIHLRPEHREFLASCPFKQPETKTRIKEKPKRTVKKFKLGGFFKGWRELVEDKTK